MIILKIPPTQHCANQMACGRVQLQPMPGTAVPGQGPTNRTGSFVPHTHILPTLKKAEAKNLIKLLSISIRYDFIDARVGWKMTWRDRTLPCRNVPCVTSTPLNYRPGQFRIFSPQHSSRSFVESVASILLNLLLARVHKVARRALLIIYFFIKKYLN